MSGSELVGLADRWMLRAKGHAESAIKAANAENDEGAAGHRGNAWQAEVCAKELLELAARLPGGGWKVEREPDPPFPNDLMVITAPSGDQSIIVYAEYPLLWDFLATLATPTASPAAGIGEEL